MKTFEQMTEAETLDSLRLVVMHARERQALLAAQLLRDGAIIIHNPRTGKLTRHTLDDWPDAAECIGRMRVLVEADIAAGV